MAEFTPIPLSDQHANPSGVPAPVSGPSIYISNPRVLELPLRGCITFKFERRPITITEGIGGLKGNASAELRLLEICNVEETEDSEEHGETEDREEDLIDKLFREARSEPEEVEETESEESEEDEK